MKTPSIKISCLCISIHHILCSDLLFHNVQTEIIRPRKSTKSGRLSEIRNKVVSSSNEITKILQSSNLGLNNHIIVDIPDEIQPSEVEEINNFWKDSKIHTSSMEKYKEMIKETNELLNSDHKNWSQRLVALFEKYTTGFTEKDEDEIMTLLKILKQLIMYDELQFDVVQVVWDKLVYLRHFEGFLGHNRRKNILHEQLDIVMEAYKDKMIKHIKSLNPGKDLIDLNAMQEKVGPCGVTLTAKWSPEFQKDLYIFWISDMITYSKVKLLPGLQKVMETQYVQTELIRSYHNLPVKFGNIDTSYTNWIYEVLSTYSDTIIECMESWKLHSSAYWFVREIKMLKPYGLKVDYDPDTHNQMKVYYFWSRHVHVFLKMKRLRETISLQKAINQLVKTKFQETCMLMRLFLSKTDGKYFPPNKPVLYQFLKFFTLNNQSNHENEYALRALSGFDNSHISSVTL